MKPMELDLLKRQLPSPPVCASPSHTGEIRHMDDVK
jgi:hypothetical protein